MSKHIRIVIFLLVLLAAVMVTSWVAAQSDTGEPNGNIVIPGSIFVRGGPGEQYIPVGSPVSDCAATHDVTITAANNTSKKIIIRMCFDKINPLAMSLKR